jgi:Protein kinase domain.
MISQIKTEIKIMYGLYHPNIIKLYNHFEENDYIYLIIEYAEGVINLTKID